MTQVELFSEESFDISMFEIDKETQMVNITKIAQFFGKNVNDWYKTAQTQSFFNSFRKKYGDTNIILSVKGGGQYKTQGTWVHRKIAIKFASWINSDFEVWCNDQLDTLFQTGSVSLNTQHVIPQTYADALFLAANQQLQIQEQAELLQLQAPKVEFVDKLIETKDAFTTTSIASEYGLTATKLNKILNNLKVQYYQDNQWILYAEYKAKGYTKTRTTLYNDDSRSSHLTVWTEKGRLFIHGLLKELDYKII